MMQKMRGVLIIFRTLLEAPHSGFWDTFDRFLLSGLSISPWMSKSPATASIVSASWVSSDLGINQQVATFQGSGS